VDIEQREEGGALFIDVTEDGVPGQCAGPPSGRNLGGMAAGADVCAAARPAGAAEATTRVEYKSVRRAVRRESDVIRRFLRIDRRHITNVK
jgi:hypothetical protein